MLSAITLFMSLDAKKEGDSHWIFNFFIRRFFRIAPMFYVAIPFAIFASSGWSVSAALNSDIGIWHALSLLTFTHGLSPYYINSVIRVEWSVAVEMMFYLMVPFLFCRIKKTYQAVYLTIILAIVGDKISGWAADHSPINDLGLWNQYLKFWIVNHMADFSMGILVYFLCKLKIDKKTGNSLIALSLLLLGCVAKRADISGLSHNIICAAVFIPLIVGLNTSPVAFFVNRFTVYLGRISFSAYLVHSALWPVVYGIFVQGSHAPDVMKYFTLLGGTLVLTIVASSFFYRFIEQPGIKLGSRFSKKNADCANIAAAAKA